MSTYTPSIVGQGAAAAASAAWSVYSPWLHARATFTRSANTTAYSAGQVVTAAAGGAIAIPNVLNAAGRSAVITDVILTSMVNATTPLQPVLYVFHAAPTSLADNAALALVEADHDLLVLAVTLTETYVTNASASPSGSRIWVARGLSSAIAPPSGTSAFIYVVSAGAYTPISGQTLHVALGVSQS